MNGDPPALRRLGITAIFGDHDEGDDRDFWPGGLGPGGRSSRPCTIPTNLNAVNSQIVLENGVVFGTVNAARRNYEQATEALAKAEPSWLSQLISRRVPLSSWPDALTRQPDDVKVTVDLRD